jgi:hypothetical protein
MHININYQFVEHQPLPHILQLFLHHDGSDRHVELQRVWLANCDSFHIHIRTLLEKHRYAALHIYAGTFSFDTKETAMLAKLTWEPKF